MTEVLLGPWDVISFPPGLWRRFENASDANAVGFAVLDPHDAFLEKDPIWPEWMVEQAAAARACPPTPSGRMIKPDNFAEIEAEVRAAIAETLAYVCTRLADERPRDRDADRARRA